MGCAEAFALILVTRAMIVNLMLGSQREPKGFGASRKVYVAESRIELT
jgi:hypothetical protein